MKRHKFAPLSVALLVSLCLITSAFGTLITESVGNVTIDVGGQFDVLVEYEVYDGIGLDNPITATGEYQIALTLTHLGDVGDLNFGRLTVFSPVAWNGATWEGSWTGDYYSGISAIGAGRAPSQDSWASPPDAMHFESYFDSHKALVWFKEFTQAAFAPGETSQQIVLTVSGDLPETILLEVNGTDGIPTYDGDAVVNLVPEPATISLLALGLGILLKKRKS